MCHIKWRAKNSTTECVGFYFGTLDDVMLTYDFHNNPQRLHDNVGETDVQPEHRPPNVIAAKGANHEPLRSIDLQRLLSLGVLALVGILSTFFIFKGKRHNDNLMKGPTTGVKCTMSDSGWSN